MASITWRTHFRPLHRHGAFGESFGRTREYVYHGVTTFTGGTGAFRNIRGQMRDISKGASKAGKALSNEVTGEGEYWFEE